jgi:signal recognition particle GTPase
MAKKAQGSKKSAKSSKKSSNKQSAKKQSAKKQAKQATTAAKPDQVEVLKLALRDTEAKLVDAEHRLRQVQQQLDDDRRALAEAAQEAVVDAAVAETVAEAMADAGRVAAGEDPAVVAEIVAETLEEVAAEAQPVARAVAPDPLTPPLPHKPAADVPSEEWTLVRLREEARRRGLPGVTNLSKARLVERLTRG